MVARALLLLLVLASCKRREDKKPTRPPCLADELDDLRVKWNVPKQCEDSEAACRKLCDDDDPDACFYVATKNTAAGEDDAKDDVALFAHACKLGLAIGCTNWAAHELFATHPSDDSQRCLYRVFAKTCDAGEPFGCSMTARILIELRATPVDIWVGFNQLSNACERFEGPPCRFLAYYLERGDFGAPDPARVTQLLARACNSGDEEACGKSRAADTLHDGD